MSDIADPDHTPPSSDARAYQEALVQRLKPGDVLFYATDTAASFSGLDPDDFDQFSVVAAYVQAFPYIISGLGNGWSPLPTDFKPWHHVAICVDPPDDAEAGTVWAVGFNQDDWQGIAQNTITPYPVGIVDGQRIVALTPPWGFDVGAVVAAAMDQVQRGVQYSKKGLLAFTQVTEARMKAAGKEREQLLDIAYGAHVAARAADTDNLKHSCVTAAASAIEAAQVTLKFVEPPVPDAAALTVALTQNAALNPALQAIKALLAQIEKSASPLMSAIRTKSAEEMVRDHDRLTAFLIGNGGLVGATGADLLDAYAERVRTRVARQVDLGGLPPALGGDVQDGAPGRDTADFQLTLQVAMREFAERGSEQDLEKLGKDDRATGPPGAGHLIVSPAMLWDALIGLPVDGGAGFIQVVI